MKSSHYFLPVKNSVGETYKMAILLHLIHTGALFLLMTTQRVCVFSVPLSKLVCLVTIVDDTYTRLSRSRLAVCYFLFAAQLSCQNFPL